MLRLSLELLLQKQWVLTVATGLFSTGIVYSGKKSEMSLMIKFNLYSKCVFCHIFEGTVPILFCPGSIYRAMASQSHCKSRPTSSVLAVQL